jgi:hypothetical protein
MKMKDLNQQRLSDALTLQWITSPPRGGLPKEARKRYLESALVQTREEAAAYYEKLIEIEVTEEFRDRAVATILVRWHIGYSFGYQIAEERDRLERLYDIDHPVLGSIRENGVPDLVKLFTAGAEARARLEEENKE